MGKNNNAKITESTIGNNTHGVNKCLRMSISISISISRCDTVELSGASRQ